jgi:hypothetical protein
MPLMASLCLASSAFAQDIITNVISPVASYQYCDAFGESTNTPVVSPVVSYQYYDSLSDLGTNSAIISPIVSYQYYEWPGSGILNLLSSPLVSYYYQPASSSGAFVLHGQVTDVHGAVLAGATVWAMVQLTPAAEATADGSGNYQMPSVGPGVYALWAWDSTHQTSIRAVTLNASTARQDFQLALLPAAPGVMQVSRQPTLAYTTGPMGSALLVFDGSQFSPITSQNVPPSDRMTIVLTHGWVQGTPDPAIMNTPFTLWPSNMAVQLRAEGVTSGMANIVAWDWRYAAMDPPPAPSDAVDHTPEQGVALGEALLGALGGGYSQPVHFLGHSLGTIVNAAAANYLHGDRTGSASQDVSPTPWSWSQTHMTLFDQAQIAELGGTQVLDDGLNPTALDAWNALYADYSTTLNWQAPLPVHCQWADNYVSVVGYSEPNAVNVWLQKGVGLLGPIAAHGYPIAWYGMSIANPTDGNNLLGFQQSYEYDLMAGLPLSGFPPANIELGSTYHQVPTSADELALEPVSSAMQPLGIGPDVVVQGAVGVVQVAGDVTADIEATAQQAGQDVSQGFNYVENVAAQGGQTVLNFLDSAVLRLTFQTSPTASSSSQFKGVTPQPPDNGTGGSNSVPMAWLPLAVPSGAVAMAFDFTVAGDPVDDTIVCGIGTNNLFSLQAKFVPTNGISASRLMDVSAWAGTTNELFFGLLGGTSTNCTVQVENIRFYSLQPPSLSVQVAGGSVVLTWPSTAGGYALESMPTLTGASWQAITNAPVLSADRYVMTNAVSGGSMFYRLRKQ